MGLRPSSPAQRGEELVEQRPKLGDLLLALHRDFANGTLRQPTHGVFQAGGDDRLSQAAHLPTGAPPGPPGFSSPLTMTSAIACRAVNAVMKNSFFRACGMAYRARL